MSKIIPVAAIVLSAILLAGCAPVQGSRAAATALPLTIEVYAMLDGYATGRPIVNEERVQRLMTRHDGQGSHSIWMLLDDEGMRRLAAATQAMAGQRLAVRFGEDWFGTYPLRGPNLDGLIEVPTRLPRSGAEAIVQRWQAGHRRPLVFN